MSAPRIRAVAIFIWISTAVLHASHSRANEDNVSIDDLVSRAQIVFGALSPNGHHAAYLVARGDPVADRYEIEVRVADAQAVGRPPSSVIASYYRKPDEMFGNSGLLLPSAGNLQWLSNDQLAFTVPAGNKTQVMAWSASAQRTHIILTSHDRVAFDLSDTSESRFQDDCIRLVATDFVERPADATVSVADYAWRMKDGYTFEQPFRNPKTGRWFRSQKWTLTLHDEKVAATSRGAGWEGWEFAPREFKEPDWSTVTVSNSSGSGKRQESVLSQGGEALAPNGHSKVISEEFWSNTSQPEANYSRYGISLKEDGVRTTLVPPAGERRPMVVLSWNVDGTGVYFLDRQAQSTSLKLVSTTGELTELINVPSDLDMPGRFYGRSSRQSMSVDRRYALLIRTSNTVPDELVKADLLEKTLSVIDSPNKLFARKHEPEVRFYALHDTNGGAWGRLYLPLKYSPDKRYPLVFTQYVSDAGYYASVGDEVPITPLTEAGIAVFALHSTNFNPPFIKNMDFGTQIDRVERPLKEMQGLITQLASEGIVDPQRVGLSGLSYGAEVAMYAYWKSNSFRAISVASASWDPFILLLDGPSKGSWFSQFGMPWPDEAGFQKWRSLAAGLNARQGLPPLLIQSGSLEEFLTVPSWTRLRSVQSRVDWFEYPSEGHMKVSPANKWWIFQRNLDWFRFWLKGEEDQASAKQPQYALWRKFRDAEHTKDGSVQN